MKKDDHLKIELDTVLEEYRVLKTEIVSNLDAARQISQLSLTAIAILIGAAPVIVQAQATFLFLVAPLLFFSLAWSQLRYIYLVLDMGNYLRSTIAPNVRILLSEITSNKKRDFSEIMSWEMSGKGPSRLRGGSNLRRMLFLPIAGSNLGIPILAALACVAAFVVFKIQGAHCLSSVEIALIAVNATALFYTTYWGFQAELKR